MRSRLPARQVIRATVADALWLPLSALLLTLLLTAAFSPAGGQSAAAGAPVATQQMPVGIPRPSFGHDVDPDRAATIFVDNTNDACDNESGTFEAPLCDLFRGGTSVTYAAGDVVHVFGGPYAISGDLTLIVE